MLRQHGGRPASTGADTRRVAEDGKGHGGQGGSETTGKDGGSTGEGLGEGEGGEEGTGEIHDEWLRAERDTTARAAQRLQAEMVGLLRRNWGREREGRRGLGRYTTSG